MVYNLKYSAEVRPVIEGVVSGKTRFKFNGQEYEIHELDLLDNLNKKEMNAIRFLTKTLATTVMRQNKEKYFKLVIELEDIIKK